MTHFFYNAIQKNAACDKGVAYIEFAVSVFVLLLMLFGVVEISRYILIVQKVEKTINTATDVVTQYATTTQPFTPTDLQQLLATAPEMMSPYGFNATGYMIVSDVSKAPGKAPVVNWQAGGGGSFVQPSRVGVSGSNPSALPNGFALQDNEEVIIGEIFYSYAPILKQNFIDNRLIYRAVVLIPRIGTLVNPLCANSYVSSC